MALLWNGPFPAKSLAGDSCPCGDRDAQPRAGCDLGLEPSLHAENHGRFNSSLSSTFSAIDETYTLRYGFGDVSVVLGYDIVTVSDFGCVGVLLRSG